jgi:endonuclease YncB( thermonuclease family)
MKLLITILVTLLVLLSSTYTAKEVRVSDGDTITVLTDNNEQIRIRLEDTFYEVFGTIEIYIYA